ncbi:hypothetical protein DdX_10577 [Ditylenchus destructor]|uniref:Uncharacterized protein n=1 Tax=Ditylenchus destructor TaxID=166010 RepID=A0AAD4N083_9BILA|nr:hypothetical protein DdX_10577 [Ditylenchus destructor]
MFPARPVPIVLPRREDAIEVSRTLTHFDDEDWKDGCLEGMFSWNCDNDAHEEEGKGEEKVNKVYCGLYCFLFALGRTRIHGD